MKNPVIEAGYSPKSGILLLEFYEEPRRVNDLILIGNDYGTELAIRSDHALISIDVNRKKITRFVNTNIQCFIRCLYAYEKFHRDVTTCSTEKEALRGVEKFEQELTCIDPCAINDPDHWWSCILEQTCL